MERFETFDDSSVDVYDHDEDDSSVEEGPRVAFDFVDDDVGDTVDPVPDPADLVDQDGNPIHQPSIDRMLAYLAGKDDDDDEEAHDLLDNVQLIHWWPEPSFRDVVEKARASQRAKVALRPGLLRNLLSAERASEIVSSLSKLTTLQLQDHDGRDFRDEGRERQDASYVAHFLRRLAATEFPDAPRLSHLELTVDCAMDPTLLSGLFARHGRTLESLVLACPKAHYLSQGVANSLREAFIEMSRLRDLQLDLYGNKFMPEILLGLVLNSRLKSFNLTIDFWKLPEYGDIDSADDVTEYWIAQRAKGMSNAEIFRLAEERLVGIVRSNRTLRQFAFKSMGQNAQCKSTFHSLNLLEALVSSSRLEDLSLKAVNLGTNNKLTREPGHRNTSLTKVRFERCLMGPDAFGLLSECVAITALEMRGCEDLPCYESWKALFQATSGLRALTVVPRRDMLVKDESMRALVDAPQTLQSLKLDLGDRDASDVHYSSIQQVILVRAESFELSFEVDRSPEPIFDGIKFTRTLARLDLHMSCSAISSYYVSTVMSSVASNASLKWLTLSFEVDMISFDSSQSRQEFTDMIRENSTLEFLAFRLTGSGYSGRTCARAFLIALLEGLKHNRTLRTLDFFVKESLSAESSHSIVKVLQRPNIRLKWIKGLSYESAEDERAIERLCVTRHARMVVDDPNAYSPLLMPRILSRLSMDGPDCVRYFLTHISRDFLGHVVPKRGTRRARTVNG